MSEAKQEKKSYFKQVIHFYFAPHLRSILTIFYLIMFGYALVYYLKNVFIALNFLLYTLHSSNAFQPLTHLFWGMGFIITLIVPFSLSLSAIFILFRIWRLEKEWSLDLKWAMTILVIIVGMSLIVFMDNTARVIAKQNALQSFIEDSGLSGRI